MGLGEFLAQSFAFDVDLLEFRGNPDALGGRLPHPFVRFAPDLRDLGLGLGQARVDHLQLALQPLLTFLAHHHNCLLPGGDLRGQFAVADRQLLDLRNRLARFLDIPARRGELFLELDHLGGGGRGGHVVNHVQVLARPQQLQVQFPVQLAQTIELELVLRFADHGRRVGRRRCGRGGRGGWDGDGGGAGHRFVFGLDQTDVQAVAWRELALSDSLAVETVTR